MASKWAGALYSGINSAIAGGDGVTAIAGKITTRSSTQTRSNCYCGVYTYKLMSDLNQWDF